MSETNSQIKKVLIIEDEMPQLGVLCDKFLIEGFQILEAKNGEDGLATALREHPDAILLDVLMPKMTGLEMVKKLREDPWGKDVPVIILSNSADPSKIQEAMEHAVFDYFVKTDTKMEEVVDKVKQVIKAREEKVI